MFVVEKLKALFVRKPSDADHDPRLSLLYVPVLGMRTISQHQRILYVLLGLALVLMTGLTLTALNATNKVANQIAATGQALMQSQRLAKSVSQALLGASQAFPDVSDSAGALAKTFRGLKSGDDDLNLVALADHLQPKLEKIMPLMLRTEKSAAMVLAQQKALMQGGASLRQINRQSSSLLDSAEAVSTLKLQQNAPAIEVLAASQLAMLSQRIGKSASDYFTAEGVNPQVLSMLDKDLKSVLEIAQGLLDGNSELRLTISRDLQTREQLTALINLYEQTRIQTDAISINLSGLGAAREAQDAILADSEPLRRELQDIQRQLALTSGFGFLIQIALNVLGLFALSFAVGLGFVHIQDSYTRQTLAETLRQDAQRHADEAKRVKATNQAAVSRLINALQIVAKGDLTQKVVVAQGITGPVADSVNSTVEELRVLVGHVQTTSTRVIQATSNVDLTSTALLVASNDQMNEIKETGLSVLDLASRINKVSRQAQESATLARESRATAESGLQAVQNAIGGMDAIRGKIHETSKGIKHLGASSVEIAEITEMISDLSRQTNLVALNSAIKAAASGEAGRGFSVLAEEAQRLAQRSSDAARQIIDLVKAIQTDTQDAFAAMEKSTHDLVDGTNLSDAALSALSDIDQVSTRMTDLIEQISNTTSREAELANVVADNIQHIFEVTEQTAEGTQSTVSQVRELLRMADDLRQSVERFKIA